MKTIIIFTLTLLLTAFAANAQITNAGFEKWAKTSFPGGDFEEPEGWLTSNFMMGLGGLTDMPVYKEAGHTGNFAMALETLQPDPDDAPVPAFAICIGDNAAIDFEGKFKVNGKPTRLEGWFRYLPVAGDTFTITAILYKNGNPIGTAVFQEGATTNTYKKFAVAVDYTVANETPDSASLIIINSLEDIAEAGTLLLVDDLELVGQTPNSTGETNDLSSHFTVYPNPTQDKIYLEAVTGEAGTLHLTVTDLSGKLLVNRSLNNGLNIHQHEEISLAGFTAGIYLVKVASSQATAVYKVIKQN